MEYLSIVGLAYLHPLARLFEALSTCNIGEPGEHVTQPESGYSISIITLSVLFAESALRRACRVKGDSPYRSALRYARREFPDYARLDQLEEIFVVRDVVVHNHLWGATLLWDDAGNMTVAERVHLAGGDPKFERVMDFNTRTTRFLGVNLVPTALNHKDAVLVFREATRFILHLESLDRRYLYLSDSILKYNGRVMRFSEFEDVVGQALAAASPPSTAASGVAIHKENDGSSA